MQAVDHSICIRASKRVEYAKADAHIQQEYEDAGAAMESKRRLSDDEEVEVKSLWSELVKLFHLDRFADDPEKLATYTKLTGAINTAKDSGDGDAAADPR